MPTLPCPSNGLDTHMDGTNACYCLDKGVAYTWGPVCFAYTNSHPLCHPLPSSPIQVPPNIVSSHLQHADSVYKSQNA